jgi:hypothetical protein
MTETLNDTLAAEAEGLPADMPPLRPLVGLDKRTRASLLRSMADIMPRLTKIQPAEPPDDPDAPSPDDGRASWAAYAKGLGVTVAKRDTKPDIQRAVTAHRTAAAPMSTHDGLLMQAELLDLSADCEDLMMTLAVNPDQLAEWIERQDNDTDVITAFLAYARGAQPGEAKRSSS